MRKGIGATKGADDPGHAAGDGAEGDGGEAAGADGGEGEGAAETPEQLEARLAAMEPEERDAEIARLEALAAEDPLVIDLGPMREGEAPIKIAAEDQQMADHIRSLKNRAATYDASMRIREEAEAYRAQADEMRYEVQLDPAGFLLTNLNPQRNPNFKLDAAHVARVLLTQPGVLEVPIGGDGTTFKDWITALAAHPQALTQEARLANAERLERVNEVKPLVERMKFENQNARKCVREAYSSVDALVPDAWTQEQRDRLVTDVTRDLQELQQSERVTVTDPRRVRGLVERRLVAVGVAPKAGKGGTAGAGAGRPGSKTPGRTGPSGQQLRQTDTLRRRAAGPGPGAGSPAAVVPKPPAGMKLTGKGNVFDFVRQHMPALRRAPR